MQPTGAAFIGKADKHRIVKPGVSVASGPWLGSFRRPPNCPSRKLLDKASSRIVQSPFVDALPPRSKPETILSWRAWTDDSGAWIGGRRFARAPVHVPFHQRGRVPMPAHRRAAPRPFGSVRPGSNRAPRSRIEIFCPCRLRPARAPLCWAAHSLDHPTLRHPDQRERCRHPPASLGDHDHQCPRGGGGGAHQAIAAPVLG